MTDGGTGSARLLCLAAALLALLFLKGMAVTPSAVRAENPPGAFDTGRALARLERILGDERPHPVDTDANDALRERLLVEILSLGYMPGLRDDFVCSNRVSRIACARVRNIVFRAGPAQGTALMLASHYDSVPAGPGAADDGIGIAAMLEIAALLAAEPPAKPVIFLLTDGEERGLLGAKSFVDTDEMADEVGRVINLEARGVRGPALMFETATPNGADARIYAAGAGRPVANSMMTDIYKLLPNDTDVSEFLPQGYGALNMALTDGVELYHTPGDRLANLDPRSLQHMGDQALGLLGAALADEPPSRQAAFTDILTRCFVLLPQWLAGALLVAGFFVAVSFFRKVGGPGPIRALLAPTAALIAAAALGWLASLLSGWIRPADRYWSAVPAAFQAVAYFAAAAAALLALQSVGRGAGRERLIASAWIWTALLGGASWLIAPGAVILFALPLALFAAAAIAGIARRRWFLPAAIPATLLALAIFAPVLHLAEIGLGLGQLAIPALVAALLFVLVLPFAVAEEARTAELPTAVAAIGLAVAFGVAQLVPAYSAAKPRGLNIVYLADAQEDRARWLAGNEAPPAAMQAIVPFAKERIAGFGEPWAAEAASVELPAPEITVLEQISEGERRRLRFTVNTYGADEVAVLFPAEAGAAGIAAGGRRTAFSGTGAHRLQCHGRACDGREFEVTLGNAAATEWQLLGITYGLPAHARQLREARPDWATPAGTGDVTIAARGQRL